MKKFRLSNGYILRYSPEHPHAYKSSGNAGYVYEHRLVIERELGRYLVRGEEVHHLNCIKTDNCPDNLILLSNAHHQRLHVWLDTVYLAQAVIPKLSNCNRCKICKWPLKTEQKSYCSLVCKKTNSTPNINNVIKIKRNRSWLATGKHYGVSDNAVRKWFIKAGLDPKNY